VDLEPVADEARDDGATARHGLDGGRLHPRLRRRRHAQRDYERSCVFRFSKKGSKGEGGRGEPFQMERFSNVRVGCMVRLSMG